MSTLRWDARAVAWAIVAVVILLLVAGIYRNARRAADFSNVKAQARTTEQSAEISRQTADTVAAEQDALWRQAQADEDYIHDRIRTRPAGTAAAADPDILRVAREAHARALCAASRVQRAGCSDDPASTAE